MKTKKGTPPVIMDVSPLTCEFNAEAGHGIVGFTATYTDGTFKNITRVFCPETQAEVQSEIIMLKQYIEKGMFALKAAMPRNTENATKSNLRKRRPS